MALFIRRRVRLEVLEAVAHFEIEREGLGAEFSRCVEAALAEIERHPLARAPYYGKARRLYLRRFPFSIYYVVEAEAVAVVAVFHSRRDPRALFARLEEEGAG